MNVSAPTLMTFVDIEGWPSCDHSDASQRVLRRDRAAKHAGTKGDMRGLRQFEDTSASQLKAR